MTGMRALALACAISVLPAVAHASGDLTVQDVIELHRAGLGEEVLLALIEVDGGPFQIEPGDVLHLKKSGLPDRVLAALIRAGRRLHVGTNVWAPQQAPAEPVPSTQSVDQLVTVPVYVPVPMYRSDRRSDPRDHGGRRAGDHHLPPQYDDGSPESSLGPRRPTGPQGAARAVPPSRAGSGRTVNAGRIGHAPAGFHPGNLAPRQSETTSSRGDDSARAQSRGTPESQPSAPTPGVARSTSSKDSPTPGVARSRSDRDEPTPGVARSRPPSDD